MKTKILLVAMAAAVCVAPAAARVFSERPGVETAKEEGKVDQILANYERFVNKYLAAMQKINDGDSSALAQLAGLQKEAERLKKQIDSIDPAEFTPAQKARLDKIQKRLLDAMQ